MREVFSIAGNSIGELDISPGANLTRADLRGADLYRADLRGAGLRGADLRRADLRGANLRGADLCEADLRGADLYRADLRGANLYRADLYEANLYRANLRGANLYEFNLRGANLRGANLRGADLCEADLRGANLSGADLRGADLRGAKWDEKTVWPAPTMLLLARWGTVSYDLCVELMRFDVANHPNPSAFDDWANGGKCPYADCQWQRCANFKESRQLWEEYGNGPALSPLGLCQWLLAEKCVFVEGGEK